MSCCGSCGGQSPKSETEKDKNQTSNKEASKAQPTPSKNKPDT